MKMTLTFALAGALVLAAAEAGAADTASQSRCTISGSTVPTADAQIFSQPTGGSPIAKLTGAKLDLRLSDLPGDVRNGRLKVVTGSGKAGYVRVEGWASPSAFRFFADENVELISGHVWLTKGMELKVVGVRDDKLEIEHRVLGTAHTLRGSIACRDVSLSPSAMDPVPTPKSARTYQMRKNSIAIYDRPGGSEVFELRLDGDSRKVFYSTEHRGGFNRVVTLGDVTIEGWARTRDLEYLHHGEVFDLNAVAPVPRAPKTLALKDGPAMLTATSELRITAKAEKDAAPIGVVEVGARFYPMEVSTEWTSVIPADLGVLPIDGGGFWVLTAELPKP